MAIDDAVPQRIFSVVVLIGNIIDQFDELAKSNLQSVRRGLLGSRFFDGNISNLFDEMDRCCELFFFLQSKVKSGAVGFALARDHWIAASAGLALADDGRGCRKKVVERHPLPAVVSVGFTDFHAMTLHLVGARLKDDNRNLFVDMGTIEILPFFDLDSKACLAKAAYANPGGIPTVKAVNRCDQYRCTQEVFTKTNGGPSTGHSVCGFGCQVFWGLSKIRWRQTGNLSQRGCSEAISISVQNQCFG